jgi:hypothetical protein
MYVRPDFPSICIFFKQDVHAVMLLENYSEERNTSAYIVDMCLIHIGEETTWSEQKSSPILSHN